MKLVSFHLMPYQPLNLEEAAKHRSPWVVLPNRLYDPVKGAEEYARHIDALVYADELGFDVHGMEGVRFYTRLKTVTARRPTGIRAGAEYVMPTMR
jgi:hypothetical protein